MLTLAGTFEPPASAATANDQEARIKRIEASVLAPCCYTEPVSIHQSEIAVKMRLEIARWVAAGRTDREILDTYVQQYGSKVLVDPRTIPGWWAPWIPWLTVIAAMCFGFWLLRRWQAKPVPDAMPSTDLAFAVLPDLDEEE
jgi:cytochrome c-type biogenesis protein CcmH/NrfF